MKNIMKNTLRLEKHVLLALKVGIGSSLAIMIARGFHLDNMISAGTITLLSLMATKWETLHLSVCRLITFLISIIIAWVIFLHVDNMFLAYGSFIFMTVLIADVLRLRATISVNAVIGAHLFITQDFSPASIKNEFLLVLTGTVIAMIVNLFQNNRSQEKELIVSMRRTEQDMKNILLEMSDYLVDPREQPHVWEDINDLEDRLLTYISNAIEYKNNSFLSHPVYYLDYFEMRQEQCQILHSLHSSLQQIRSMPAQASIVSEYISYLTNYIIETNHPEEQELVLNEIIDRMKNEDLPKSREEFENRALLYHILMDLMSFLNYKKEFAEKLDQKQLDAYWASMQKGKD